VLDPHKSISPPTLLFNLKELANDFLRLFCVLLLFARAFDDRTACKNATTNLQPKPNADTKKQYSAKSAGR
jgi:hypothetical protein